MTDSTEFTDVWQYSTVDGAKPSTNFTQDETTQPASSALRYFGKRVNDDVEANMPMNTNVNVTEKMGTYTGTLTKGNSIAENLVIKSYVHNALPLYWLNGQCTAVASTSATIGSYAGNRRKPRLRVWEKIGGADVVHHGVMIHDLKLDWNFQSKGLVATMIGKGGKTELLTTLTANATSPKYPGQTTKGTWDVACDPYNKPTAAYPTWKNEEFGANPISINIHGWIDPSISIGSNGYIEEISEYGLHQYTASIGFLGDFTAGKLMTDYFAGNDEDLVFQFKKGTLLTETLAISMSQALCKSLTAVKREGKIVGWTAVFQSPTLTAVETSSKVDAAMYLADV